MNFRALVIVSGLVLLTTACECKPSHDGGDTSVMKAALLEQVPLGTPFAEARRRMKSLGYRVTEERNAAFAESGQTHYGLTYLYCTCSEGAGFPVSRDWKVAVVHGPEGVIDILVAAGLTGP